MNQTDSSEPQVATSDQSSTLTDDNDEIDIDFLYGEEDSLTNLEHMQENSLDAFLNVGVDEGLPARADNQEEYPVDSAPVVTQETNTITPKEEPVAEEIVVKVEPGSQSQVITAEFFRGFLKASLVRGKTPPHQSKKRKGVHQGSAGTI
jgi:hypothetical protein